MLYTITERCNLHCKHCLGRYGAKGRDMSLDDFKFALNQTARFDNVLIVSGGEPLLHPDFRKMIQFALNKPKLIIIVLTNGTLLRGHTQFLKQLIERQQIFVQVTNDSRYYDCHTDEETCRQLNLEVTRKLASVDSLGRAKDNAIPSYGRKYPLCTNLILGAAQTHSFEELVTGLETACKFCLFTIEPNLDLMLSECHQIKLTNLKEYNWKEIAFSKLRKESQTDDHNIYCSNCGMDNCQIFGWLN